MEETATHVHRGLAPTWTPDTCYEACLPVLAPQTSFVVNIYFDGQGQQVCTCCRVCDGVRYVPRFVGRAGKGCHRYAVFAPHSLPRLHQYIHNHHSGQIFAACGAADMSVGAQAKDRRVKPGKVLTYRVALRSPTKKGTLDLEGLALRVVLPDGTRYVKGTINLQPKGRKRREWGPKINDNTVTWQLSALSWGSRMARFTMAIRVDPHLQSGTALTLQAFVFQDSGSDLPICSQYANNVTVAIK